MKRAFESTPRGAEGGFTLVEVLVVVAILGILVNIAVPRYMEARQRAIAATVVGDYHLLHQAVYEYYGDHGEFPRNRGRGREPLELRPYLGQKIRWQQGDLAYQWENWVRKDGTPKRRKTGVLYGFSVFTDDESLMSAIEKVYTGPTTRIGKNRITFVIEPIAD